MLLVGAKFFSLMLGQNGFFPPGQSFRTGMFLRCAFFLAKIAFR